MSRLKITVYNRHGYHMMLLLFFAITIRVVKATHSNLALIRMCHCWNAISKKVLTHEELIPLLNVIAETMFLLEMAIPHTFFHILKHYMIHLVDQIFVLGMHHIFPFELQISLFKHWVRNHSHHEGSIIEAYTTEDGLEYYNDYIKDGKQMSVPVSWCQGKLPGKGIQGMNTLNLEYSAISEAHYNILHQTEIARSYIQKHLQQLRKENKDVSEDYWIMSEHKCSFTKRLKDQNLQMGQTPEEMMMHCFPDSPLLTVKTWQVYEINMYTLYTVAKDKKSKNQKCSVTVVIKDRNGHMNINYGYIDEIWEINYSEIVQIPIFKCQRVKHPQGVAVDKIHFALVDLNILGHIDDP